MPPKARITKEMILEAAFAIARESGASSVNARTVAARLGCSTQPVMYHFKTIEELKIAVYQRADEFHTQYLMTPCGDDPMMSIGLNFIRFAATEKNLFRLLFQSNQFAGENIMDLIGAENVAPIVQVLAAEAEVEPAQAERILLTLALYVHGYASVLANNATRYDEATVAKELERVFIGAVYAAKEEEPHE